MVTKSWTKKLIIMNKPALFTINIVNHKCSALETCFYTGSQQKNVKGM